MTDRTLRVESDLDGLEYDAGGLVPVVAQDVGDGRLLLLAWADRTALVETLRSGQMHFWSRSRNELWRKGATSGNTFELVSLHADCDLDSVLARVRPAGPACHTGETSCFGAGSGPDSLGTPDPGGSPDPLDALADVIRERSESLPANSYTTRLLGDENLRLKKLGEETAELVLALARGEATRAVEEASDLVFHLLVALAAAGRGLDDVRAELARRGGLPVRNRPSGGV